MKLQGIINLCVALLWFVASHHCAFELFSDDGHKQSSSHSSATSADPTASECPSHRTGDPSAHQEGKFCGVNAQLTSLIKLNHAVGLQLSAFNLFLALSSRIFENLSSSSIVLISSSDVPNTSILSHLAHSLSRAPNAPPVTLA